MSTLDRRAFLATGAAASAAPAAAQAPVAATAPKGDPALAALLDRLVEESLERSPRQATSLGLDVGARAALRSRVEDRSADARDRRRKADAKALADLRTIDRAKLNAGERVTYDTVEFQLTSREALSDFAYGDGDQAPYTLTQRDGAYQSIPDFLDNQQPVTSRADAEAFLARIDGFATALDQETERFQSEVAARVTPPSYVLDTTLVQLRALRDAAPASVSFVRALDRKAVQAGLGGSWGPRASALVAAKVAPALTRQITAVERARPAATTDAGAWKLPDGAAFYAAALRYSTTTTLSPDEVHALGLEQVADLTRRIDAVLTAQGITSGTVPERLTALGSRPEEIWPNTDAGKEQLLASLNAQIVALQPRLPRVFARIPKAPVEVRRVPPSIEAGSSGGYYQSPPLDGSRPGAYYINLQNTADRPKYTLPTLTYHESNPGHHLQNALLREDGELPLYRRGFSGFSAYGEGWGLYAEQVADELGVYDDYPLGRVGMYQSYMFRAARLVVDTGLHHKRWTREQARAWFRGATGQPTGQIAREVDRYIVYPGQACSYKIGQTTILRLREVARRRLGARFDVKRFHSVVLGTGSVPLTVLERVVNAWNGA